MLLEFLKLQKPFYFIENQMPAIEFDFFKNFHLFLSSFIFLLRQGFVIHF